MNDKKKGMVKKRERTLGRRGESRKKWVRIRETKCWEEKEMQLGERTTPEIERRKEE